jgi:four helix bundle protein
MGDSKIKSYRDLRVWQEAVNLAEVCYRLTTTFPKDELYGMTTQIRQIPVSVAVKIAQGWYGGKTRREYIHSLHLAQGSLKELETHLLISQRVELASCVNINPILNQCELVGKLLQALIHALEQN